MAMNGLFVVNKPAGMTSHDVVNAVRRLVNTRRVGHTGTLDPMATGVLILLVGQATRLAQYLSGGDKAYHALVRFGEETTTYDREGEVVARSEVKITRSDVALALQQFRGHIEQIPPMYSAIKVKGQKLYKLARRGEEIQRPPRHVTIHRLLLLDWTSPDLTLDVLCSAGTYIRSLAHDLGRVLGCGGHLRALTRTAAGRFRVAESVTLEALRALAAEGRLEQAMLPPQAALDSVPVVQLTSEQERAVRYGQSIPLSADMFVNAGQVQDCGFPDLGTSALLQAHDDDGHLVAVLIPDGKGDWRPKIVLQA